MRTLLRPSTGFTLIELIFALAVIATVTAVAIPVSRDALDELNSTMAVRYLGARLAGIRMDAVTQSRCLAFRFEPSGGDYRFRLYADGNANGVRAADIAAGVDVPMGPPESLAEKFPGVTLGLMDGHPDADGVAGTGPDGVRIGKAQILTLSPDGTATSGSLYLHGARSQFAVRILGTTGRVRVLQYRPSSGTWITR